MTLRVRPCELKEANAFIAEHHRHHKPVQGHRFSLALFDDDKLVGVAICGRPVARHTDQKRVLEVTRLCTDGSRDACSCLYSAAARIAKEAGYWKIQTFILKTEPGISLKACGWTCEGEAFPSGWQNGSRKRNVIEVTTIPKWRYSRILNPEWAPVA